MPIELQMLILFLAKEDNMKQKKKEIKIIDGDTDILLIAPHSPIIGKVPKNDRNTGMIRGGFSNTETEKEEKVRR